jgi:hypothetical protein
LSPRKSSGKGTAAPAGSGPGGRVQITDIRSKLEEIRGDADQTVEKARPVALIAGIAGGVLLLGVTFYLGRRRGRRKSTWVEIRRQ